jgi:hypothetical protein
MFGRDVGMATRASVCLVNGRREPGLVHEQGNLPTGSVGFCQRFVRVTFEAVAVLDDLCH